MVDSTEDKRIDFIVELLVEIRNLLLKAEQRMQELEARAKLIEKREITRLTSESGIVSKKDFSTS